MPITRRTARGSCAATLHDDPGGRIVVVTINGVRYVNTSTIRARLQVGLQLDPQTARELHEMLTAFLAGDDALRVIEGGEA